jgi:hypothetical protein
MNLAEKPHQDVHSAVSSVHRRSPVFRIHKRFLSKFITAATSVIVRGPGPSPCPYSLSCLERVMDLDQ